ncbi:MAG: hypothetical protein ACOYBY_18175 [Dermatophilaceae bacterium]
MKLDELHTGVRLAGVVPAASVTVLSVQWHGADAVELTYQTTARQLAQRVVFRADEPSLYAAHVTGRPFDAPRRSLHARRRGPADHAGRPVRPMLAGATSDVQPLPHQIRAVYGELLPRTPLRFLLADDPGAGKTIMAGLYIKVLLLREDVRRCLVVAPGGLVEQCQDGLFFKFGLRWSELRFGLTWDSTAFVVRCRRAAIVGRDPRQSWWIRWK